MTSALTSIHVDAWVRLASGMRVESEVEDLYADLLGHVEQHDRRTTP